MIEVKCVDKLKDKRGNITKYKLVDKQGQVKVFTAAELKQAIQMGNLTVVNLTLTKDNRLVNKGVQADEHSGETKRGTIPLDTNKTYTLRLGTGCLEIEVSGDSDYPGIDIEFKPDDDKLADNRTYGRVLIEQAKSSTEKTGYETVKVRVWGSETDEDYTHKEELTRVQSGI